MPGTKTQSVPSLVFGTGREAQEGEGSYYMPI